MKDSDYSLDPWRSLIPIVVQIIFGLTLVGLSFWLFNNLKLNLNRANLSLGFDFLSSQSTISIREAPFRFSSTDSYFLAILAGLVNSLKVAGFSILLATILGTTIGLAQLSSNWLVKQLARVYVETLRNIPLILQLFFCYSVFFLTIPNGESFSVGSLFKISIEGIDLLGLHLSAEFTALVLGLSLFAAAFIAEVWRGAILSVAKTQWQAAQAIGLANWQITLWVIVPQALRVVIPPLTNQYLNILKNSSLAIAIGYEDLMAIASKSLNQTGKSVEIICMTMAIYLILCLAIAFMMNWLNERLRIGVQRN
jgi:general L-amino acid transport system permease protein